MMYVEPTSQYKFVAKPVPSENIAVPLVGDGASGAVATSNLIVPVAASTAANPLPPTNTATHFLAPEHVQNKTLNRQVSTNAPSGPQGQGLTYDGKRMRKAVQRRTVDYNSSVIRYLESRKWFKSSRNQFAIQPREIYNIDVVPPGGYIKNPMNAVTTKFVRTSTNKLRCPIFCVVWTPEGRRLVTGASSGEFTLWNGLTFNFETILQAHDRAVRSMVWSHHDVWLLTGDHGGFVKYWQSNMNNVKMYEAHKEPIRGLSFSPSDSKFASCSDDGLVKVWDFYRCVEERQLKGHGADVKCVDWHPSKGLVVSGSKDSQQPIKLWDPKSGNSITTLHAHKSTVMAAKWNSNGNWLLTGSRDHMLKVFDIRVMKEFQTFRGHKKEATAVAWHPIHETLFSSGGSDGSIMFWLTGVDEKAGSMDKAHEGIVWSLAWHPVGHILCSGSNDHTSKFWTRNRPGDTMHDRYNLDINQQDDAEYNEDGGSSSMLPGLAAYDSTAIIPGVGVPVTASNVVLPDSNDTDEDVDLYGDSRRDNFPRPQPTSSSNVPPPSSSHPVHPVHPDIRPGILGQFSSGKPPIPGLSGPNAGMLRGPGNEGVRDGFNSLRGMPPGPRRPELRPPRPGFDRNGDFPNNQAPVRQRRPPFPGSRPQFRPGPRPGVDFFPRGGPGNRDPGMNFRPPGSFPPNQFMRFPGPAGPGPRGGPNFRPRAMGDHPRDLGPRPHGFVPPRPELRHADPPMRDREDAESGEEHRGAGMEPERRRSNDSPRVSPPRLANSRGRSERRGSDPSAPGILGDYETHQRELGQRVGNQPQAAGEGQLFRGNSLDGGEQAPPSERRLPEPPNPNPSDRPGQGPPSFGRQNSNPRAGQPFQPHFERPDKGRLEDRERTHDRPGRPGLLGEPALDRPDMARPEDRPLHDRPRPGERGLLGELPLDRPDMGHPGERGALGRPGMPHFGDRPPHDRPDMGRPGDRPPHERPDMGRPGDRSPHERPDFSHPGDRPPHERPDMGRPGDRPPHDRPDMGRPGDRPPHERPDMGRPGDRPPHERPDMGRPGDRPPHERPDMGHPDDPKFRNRPEFGRPDDRQMRDRPDDRGPPRDQGRPYDGPPNHRPPRPGMGPPFPPPPPRDPQFHGNERPRADLPPDRGDFDRSPRDRVPPERPESKPMFHEPPDRADGPPNGEQGNIKPLMGVMCPRTGQDPPEAETRGRKRSMEHEFDRAPKRMEPGDHRDGAW